MLSLDAESLRRPPTSASSIPAHRAITDLLTFYADLWLAEKLGTLRKPGWVSEYPSIRRW